MAENRKTDDDTTLSHPVCHDAKGACPPEDCGGPWGYEGIKGLFSIEPHGKDTKEYLKWMGLKSVKEFDPKYVSIEDINNQLKLLAPVGTRELKSSLSQKQQGTKETGI